MSMFCLRISVFKIGMFILLTDKEKCDVYILNAMYLVTVKKRYQFELFTFH